MHYYDVFPKMVPADELSEIRVTPRFEHVRLQSREGMSVWYFPFSGKIAGQVVDKNFCWDKSRHLLDPASWELKDGVLIIRMVFAGEQQHRFQLEYKRVNPHSGERTIRCSVLVYSLKPDLYRLRPFKGDFHIHSSNSDGREAPEYVAARYRQMGFDFTAISDHRQYEPSIRTRDFWAPYDLDFKLYPGEEVHSPGNEVHIIDFAARQSVNDMWRADEEKYRREVAEIEASIPQEERVPGADYFQVAASEWVFQRIQANGGLAVFCHPFWFVGQNVLSEALVEAVLARRKFDALEVIGGCYMEQNLTNNLIIMRWMEEMKKGVEIPPVGVSDSHGTDRWPLEQQAGFMQSCTDNRNEPLFNWYYTIVFAEENSAESLIEHMRKGDCLAVKDMFGDVPDFIGRSRLVKYAAFLHEEYFSITHALCETEGRLMQDILAGDTQAVEALKAVRRRVSEFREKCFAR